MNPSQRTVAILAAVAAGLSGLASPAAAETGATAGGAAAPSTGALAPLQRKAHASGIATWFGPGFYGHKTACGQTLTEVVVGVANRTLPCGTLVRVTYGGRALIVPVIDRGPYSRAEWDLTAGAAAALGITETVRIHTRIVGRTANTATLGSPAPLPAATSGGVLAG